MSGGTVAIVDGGGTNIASLENAIRRIGAEAELTADADVIRSANHVILPGVGAAAPAMRRLADMKLVDVIRSLEQPVLGICLGMQLLGERSEEEDVPCIGIFPGTASRLSARRGLPVPNMGWCRVEPTAQSPLFDGIPGGSWFYFVHSYALPVGGCTTGTSEHCHPFSSALEKGNFHAVQFHPERSSAAGSRLLRNFLAMAA